MRRSSEAGEELGRPRELPDYKDGLREIPKDWPLDLAGQSPDVPLLEPTVPLKTEAGTAAAELPRRHDCGEE